MSNIVQTVQVDTVTGHPTEQKSTDGVALVSDVGGSAAVTATTGSKTGGTAAASSMLVGGVYNTTLPTLTNGQQAALQLGTRGNLGIQIGDPTGTSYAVVAGSSTDNISASTVGAMYTQNLLRLFNGTGWDRWRGTTVGAAVVVKPETSGGTSGAKIIAAASTNATSIKASAGQIFGIELANNAAYAVFLKLYNKASAPTVGTDTPVRTIQIPAGGRCEINRPLGFAFSTGIAYAITKLVADADTTVVVADDLVGSIDYV
jgi:hypothetical protein